MTYSDYISLLLVCGDYLLTSKMGLCWNLLESTPAIIPLIKSSHKWTQIIFIISNTKLGIRLFSHPRIDLNSQSNFYDDLTRPYKYLSKNLYKTTCTQDNLHINLTNVYNDLTMPYKYLSKNLYKTTCTQENLHISFTRL